ncbi:MAG: hypothetical protein SPG48_12750 [Treponema sp.]|nr:hypothetical protein [Treponema sp.]
MGKCGRDFIKTAVRTESKAARDDMEFLIEFWDYEKSPYIRELHLQGKSCTKIGDQRICMIGSGLKKDRVFAYYVI